MQALQNLNQTFARCHQSRAAIDIESAVETVLRAHLVVDGSAWKRVEEDEATDWNGQPYTAANNALRAALRAATRKNVTFDNVSAFNIPDPPADGSAAQEKRELQFNMFVEVDGNFWVPVPRREPSKGCVLLAWKLTRASGTTRQKMVGIATMTRLTRRNLTETSKTYLTPRALQLLESHMNDCAIIDTLCSLENGEGRLLTMHALAHAFGSKLSGLVAHSFTSRQSGQAFEEPESLNMFQLLGFQPVFEGPTYFRSTNVSGTFFAKMNLDMQGFPKEAVRLCARENDATITSFKCI